MLNLIYNENPKEAQRLFHGRGKSLKDFDFFNIDYFPPVILITLYRELTEELQEKLVAYLRAIPNLNIQTILLQKRYLRIASTELIYGDDVDEIEIEEDNTKFLIKLRQTQNIGFFLDMKLGRELLKQYADNKKILNLFSYTCAFSVIALKSGAKEVINFDMAKASLARGKDNHIANKINLSKVRFFPHDIFKSFALLKKLAPYDFVIIDPPTDQGASFKVDRDYPKLCARIKDWTHSGALVMTCLNSPFHDFNFLIACIQKNAPDLELLKKCGAPLTFSDTEPEKGLKIILWRRN